MPSLINGVSPFSQPKCLTKIWSYNSLVTISYFWSDFIEFGLYKWHRRGANITFGRKHIKHPSTQHQYYLGYYFSELSLFRMHHICLWVIISDERTNNLQFSSAAFFILPYKLSTKLKYKFPNTSPKTSKTGTKEKKKKKTKTQFSRVGQTR